jgi:DNA-binding IclR family transcriptional regulator
VIEEIHGPRMVAARGWLGSTLTSPASGFVRQMLAELPEAELAPVIRALPLTAHTPRTIRSPEQLLAEITKIRRDGHHVIIDEYEEGLAGVGVPVKPDGVLVAMLAVGVPTVRFDETLRNRALTELHNAAQQLERRFQ